MSARAAAVILIVALGLVLVVAAGPAALAYAPVFVLAVLPGLPLGFLVFGRGHAAGWIGGALVGYGLTQLSLWAVIVLGRPSIFAFTLAWVVLCGATTAIYALSKTRPVVAMPAWTPTDTRALVLVLLLVPALMGPPYANVGRRDAAGNLYYRAYFTADFLWHTALANELAKFSLPPRNPYLAPRAMNYYWTYFLLPATVARLPPGDSIDDVQVPLKANAVLAGTLMIGALFLLVRSATSRAWPAATAVSLAVLAPSAEGLYEIVDLVREGRPWADLLDTNIDAVTAWRFNGLRIDDIPRSLWYTPQHTTAIALGLIGLLICAHGGARARLTTIAVAGVSLGLATTMNPLLGAVCSIIYGIAVLVDAASVPRGWLLVPRHVLAAVPVFLAVAWGAASRVMDGAGSVLDFGLHGYSRFHPFLTLALALGPVLAPALPGLALGRGVAKRPVAIGAAGLALGLLLLYFVRISDASWVGFRAGQILLVSIPILLARTLEWLRLRGAVIVSLVVLAIGLPTTLVDTWNAQDISNRRPGPGFRWTLWVTPAQQEAFRWIRTNTPMDAVVQMEPVLRGREHWTLVPSFAARRMAAGLPISLLPLPDYEQRSQAVRQLFASPSVDEASAIAHRLRIDYLYVDRDDVAAYGAGVQKFDEHPERFERVFANDEVKVYRIH